MARPRKNNADYFPHDCDAKEDEKIVYLESLFGDSGYAWYFKMLESFARCENFEMPWSDMKCAIMARKFNADLDKFSAFIVAATTPEIDIFRCDNGMLYSAGLKKRLVILVEKRERDAERIAKIRNPEIHNSLKNEVVAATTTNVAATSTQSKVKESKVKESKVLNKEKKAQAQVIENGNENAEKEGIKKSLTTPGGAPDPPQTLGDQVMQWARNNRKAILAKAREVGLLAHCESPQEAANEVQHAIEEFCAHHAERVAFQDNPILQFQEKYPTWFRIRVEKRIQSKKGGDVRKPVAKKESLICYSQNQCVDFFRSRYGTLTDNLTQHQMLKMSQCKTKDELSQVMEQVYENLKHQANKNARRGTVTLGEAAGSAIPS